MSGAWPEWINELGAPRQGGRTYDQCIYRPLANCDMRALFQPFCPVCNQRWSLVFFGHPRVSPSAPIASKSPSESSVSAYVGVPIDFSVGTRLSVGPGVTNSEIWRVTEPGATQPTTVASGTTAHTHTFTQDGQHVLSCEVTADTNFVKPERYGSNQATATWTVEVSTLAVPPEVSAPGSVWPLLFTDAQTLVWEDASANGAFSYNLYRGDIGGLAAGSYGACLQPGVQPNGAVDSETPATDACWCYLVTGENPAGEGPLGQNSQGQPRPNGAPCN